ncbi:hypothetical protein B4119_0392 [Parageobacillus caldoxylosilyticus]|uniref:Uncharacterized protein n=1 Tax=Saccharococcus caldoxylosilyticus TaxID=81408 RepID=A0A150KTT8_9BACL|nr:hypothetical protein B4119_0392 [Parageobacillus caldoxylosilyticus]
MLHSQSPLVVHLFVSASQKLERIFIFILILTSKKEEMQKLFVRILKI